MGRKAENEQGDGVVGGGGGMDEEVVGARMGNDGD